MKKQYLTFLVALFILSVISIGVFAAPPEWAKGGKGKTKTPLQTITAQTTTQPTTQTTTTTATKTPQTTAPTQQQQTGASNATATTAEEGINWEAVSVVLVIIGALIGWYVSRKMRSKSAFYLKEIDAIYKKHQENPEAMDTALSELRERIERDFESGKITDQAIALLEARIDKYTKMARMDTISTGLRLPKTTKRQIKEMLEDGIISEEEYERFADMDLTHLSQKDYEKLTRLMQKWKMGK